MATSAAAIIAKRRRDIISRFMGANAVGPDSAILWEPNRLIDRRLFARLEHAGVLVPSGGGRYYLDVPAYDAHQRRRRRRVGVIMATLVAGAGAAVALFG